MITMDEKFAVFKALAYPVCQIIVKKLAEGEQSVRVGLLMIGLEIGFSLKFVNGVF